ncbi:tubulin--tyrosine ligase-like protein 12 [Culicoides brevitarsis]|uniref:tubulin--tyrosine ligase-like protein 12 n=1 Tax=Culicoides brevitarsis TaxID=469753 RepID=UPI00307BB33F
MESFIELHRPQLQGSGVPPHYWPVLYEKIANQTFDAGLAFQLLQVDYGDDGPSEEDPVYAVATTKPISLDDSNAIFLIDHAWTFRLDMAKKQLETVPGLLDRMSGIMGVNTEENDQETSIEKVLNAMWRYVQTYSVNASGLAVENRMPIWYIVDEVGSAVHHSDTPNFRMVPFMHVDEQITYSLLFPIKDIDEGDLVTRDFVEGVTVKEHRDALLLPWRFTDFESHSFEFKEPPVEYFLHGHIEETLPGEDVAQPKIDPNRPLRVFAEYDMVKEHLTDPAFEIVENEETADILWYTKHFKGFKELSETMPDRFVNQFPFENVLTIKDLLSIVARRASEKHFDLETLEGHPKWLPVTFNLRTEIVEFAAYYQNRAAKELDNHWIVKPFNLARGLDTHITSNIAQIMRHSETGPKIAQKYIEKPVLFHRPEVEGKVKFDIRYVVMLKEAGAAPEVYMYNNFFLRFANKPYELNDFDVYEKHFTVMNYVEHANLHHLKCEDFLIEWAKQYPDHPWQEIEDQIAQVFKELFEAACKKPPPCGIAKSPQSRGVYAADLMLGWEGDKMQVKLLEMNYTPDCQRACQYYENFFNDIFKLLFLNEFNDLVFRRVN